MSAWWHWALWVVAQVALSVALHEAGHIVLALALGARLRALGLGVPLPSHVSRKVGSCVVFVGAFWWQGVTAWPDAPKGGWSRAAWAWVVVGGPLANLFAGIWMLHSLDLAWQVAGVMNLLNGLVNLMPAGRGGRTPSDGEQLLALWLGKSHAARLLAERHPF